MAGTRDLFAVAQRAEVVPTCDPVRLHPGALSNPQRDFNPTPQSPTGWAFVLKSMVQRGDTLSIQRGGRTATRAAGSFLGGNSLGSLSIVAPD